VILGGSIATGPAGRSLGVPSEVKANDPDAVERNDGLAKPIGARRRR
jgi:hypothetical protein